MKKLLLLGGSRYLIPVIKKAQELGVYVITCDYLPDNIGHKYSDEYVNISIVEKELVLKYAIEAKIDGIMSFACDPGVVTAAYVAEKMHLPHVADYSTVHILQNKDLFRKFLADNGFNVPNAKSFDSIEAAKEYCSYVNYPIMIKPVDSAGSKGVTRVDCIDGVMDALLYAFRTSFSRRIIIEDVIESEGDPSDCDCLSINGKMVYVTFSGQKFDCKAKNPYTPAGFVFPSEMKHSHKQKIADELQRLVDLLHLKTSIYNVETRVGKDNKVYLMEVSPRGGGNRLAEMVRFATGIDLIEAAIRASVGENLNIIPTPIEYKDYWYEHILHSNKQGLFKKLVINENLKKYLVECDLWIKEKSMINEFSGANETIGTLIFKFSNEDVAKRFISTMSDMVEVIVE